MGKCQFKNKETNKTCDKTAAYNFKYSTLSNEYELILFLATGICGGFTTFSTFSAENMLMIKAGNYLMAGLYIFTSVAACIIATFVGFKFINN